MTMLGVVRESRSWGCREDKEGGALLLLFFFLFFLQWGEGRPAGTRKNLLRATSVLLLPGTGSQSLPFCSFPKTLCEENRKYSFQFCTTLRFKRKKFSKSQLQTPELLFPQSEISNADRPFNCIRKQEPRGKTHSFCPLHTVSGWEIHCYHSRCCSIYDPSTHVERMPTTWGDGCPHWPWVLFIKNMWWLWTGMK